MCLVLVLVGGGGGAGLFVIAVTGFWLALGCCVSCVLLLFILLLCGCISVSLY